MTGNAGRTINLYWGSESPQPLVAGLREKGITVNGEPIDLTNDDSNGWRELADIAQINSVDIPCSGVLVDDTLRADMFAGASATGSRMQSATFEYPLESGQTTPATITGTFYLQEYSETGPHDGEITFEATFVSNGVVTYTAGS